MLDSSHGMDGKPVRNIVQTLHPLVLVGSNEFGCG